MITKTFKVVDKYYNASGEVALVEYLIEYSDGVNTSIGAGQFKFNASVMSLPLPTGSSTDAEVEQCIRDSDGSYQLDIIDEFHHAELAGLAE